MPFTPARARARLSDVKTDLRLSLCLFTDQFGLNLKKDGVNHTPSFLLSGAWFLEVDRFKIVVKN